MGWIVVLYRLPPNNSRARVAIWRELRRSGALHVQQSVVAVPDDERFAGVVERLREVVAEVGGHVTALRTEPMDGGGDCRLIEAWNQARQAEYRELAGQCAKFLAEIDHEFEIEKFTHAELDEEEAELEKLQSWLARIQRLDLHGAAGAEAGTRAVAEAEQALARYSTAVFERTQP
jgi:hypothetical protein